MRSSMLMFGAVLMTVTAGCAGQLDGKSGSGGSGSVGSGGNSGAGGSSGSGGATGSGGSTGAGGSGGSTGAGGGTVATGAGPTANCPPSWTTTPSCGGSASTTAPNFGPNVKIFDPSMSGATIQAQTDAIYAQQDANQFGPQRYAYFFKPGSYSTMDLKVGFYTQVLGLGHGPDDASIDGNIRVKGDWMAGNNSTCNFWRGAENISMTPTPSIDDDNDIWAVSQGAQLRRVHVKGNLALHDYGGWSSGGFMADSLVDGQLISGSQQQFITRNNQQSWTGGVWNMVFVGNMTAPAASWPAPPYTISAMTPKVREKPFLFTDAQGNYLVMVPSLKSNVSGRSWTTADAPGVALSIGLFYVATPSDTATTLNAALAAGKHLLFTPGIYHLSAALHVTQPGTILLGLGIATLINDSATPIVSVDDIDNVTLAGFLMEAGPNSATTLLQLGAAGSTRDHVTFPTLVADVHCRVGGANPGTVQSCVIVNSRNVILDNVWLWRADHGAGAGWTSNVATNGIIVNADNVTAYGLFVEHFQQYQTLWNGNGGTTYFYQSEMPYDPPNQAAWMAAPGHNGYPSYKVAAGVTSHHAEGLGIYSVFTLAGIAAENAIETPAASGISMSHMVTANLAQGSVTHIINGTGAQVDTTTMTAYSAQ